MLDVGGAAYGGLTSTAPEPCAPPLAAPLVARGGRDNGTGFVNDDAPNLLPVLGAHDAQRY